MNGIDECLAAIRLSRMPGVGAASFRKLIVEYATPSRALSAYCMIRKEPGHKVPKFCLEKSPTNEGLKAAEQYLKSGGRVIYFGHEDYPEELGKITEPPPVLFLRGTLRRMPLVAVVGARNMLDETQNLVNTTVAFAASNGFGIISGGAAGVDAAAHRAALKSALYTVAVLGTGVDISYPPENAALFSEIAGCGGLLSELLPGTRARRGFFPTRNRIIAGMARAVIVIQAARRSGSLITAALAGKFGRPVFVHKPSGVGPEWYGNRHLLDCGCREFDSECESGLRSVNADR